MIAASRARLMRCVAVSLLLHGVLALPLAAAYWRPSPPRQAPQALALDVMGMISTRQVEQQNTKAAPAQAHAAPRRAPHKTVHLNDHVAGPVSVPEPEPAAEPAPTPAPAPPDDAEQRQVQQTIQPPESEAPLTRRYVMAMSKVIQSKLIYPQEAREAGYVGRPKIRFTVTEDGDILPGTLGIRTSSGYTLLDDYALRAAQASAPFSKPFKRMEVVIAVSFTSS